MQVVEGEHIGSPLRATNVKNDLWVVVGGMCKVVKNKKSNRFGLLVGLISNGLEKIRIGWWHRRGLALCRDFFVGSVPIDSLL